MIRKAFSRRYSKKSRPAEIEWSAATEQGMSVPFIRQLAGTPTSYQTNLRPLSHDARESFPASSVLPCPVTSLRVLGSGSPRVAALLVVARESLVRACLECGAASAADVFEHLLLLEVRRLVWEG